MKILIMGGGAAGSTMAKFLCDDEAVESVIIGDIELKRAKKFIIPHQKLSLKKINASNKEEVLKFLKEKDGQGINLLINASLPAFNVILLESCLEAGINYQDLASDWRIGKTPKSAKIEQLQYNEKFKEKGLVGLINASASPGLSNLLCRELADKFKKIDYIKIRLLEDINSDTPFTAWSKDAAFDEFAEKPLVWAGDHFEARNNFSEEEIFNFPEPFNNQKCFLVAQEEVGTLPLYIKTKYIDIKGGGSEFSMARTLYKLGLFNNREIAIKDTKISPYSFFLKIWPNILAPSEMISLINSGKLHNAHFWLGVEVFGISEGQKMTIKSFIKFPSQIEINKIYPGANFISYPSGLSSAIFALSIVNINQKGVFPPEALSIDNRKLVFGKLKKYNIEYITESSGQNK